MLFWCVFLNNLPGSFSSCGMAPAPYFKRRIFGDHSLLFFTFVIYYNVFYFTIIICNCLPGVPKSDSRPA